MDIDLYCIINLHALQLCYNTLWNVLRGGKGVDWGPLTAIYTVSLEDSGEAEPHKTPYFMSTSSTFSHTPRSLLSRNRGGKVEKSHQRPITGTQSQQNPIADRYAFK